MLKMITVLPQLFLSISGQIITLVHTLLKDQMQDLLGIMCNPSTCPIALLDPQFQWSLGSKGSLMTTDRAMLPTIRNKTVLNSIKALHLKWFQLTIFCTAI